MAANSPLGPRFARENAPDSGIRLPCPHSWGHSSSPARRLSVEGIGGSVAYQAAMTPFLGAFFLAGSASFGGGDRIESMLLLAALVALHLPPVSPTVPNRQPQLAAAGGTMALVFGSGEAIYLARSLDNWRSFAAPSKVADLPKMLLGRHRGPRVAIGGNAIVVSAIASVPGDLLVWRSTDGGRTWSVPVAINDTPKAAREGLHAMVGDAEGHMAAAWLDDRGAKGKRLYGAFSNDAGLSWSHNVLLYESPDGTICECCDPSLAVMGHGEFAVMWRNKLGGSRDLYTLRLRDGRPVGAAVKQGDGTWKLDACPMDGGGVAVRDGQIASVWLRARTIRRSVRAPADSLQSWRFPMAECWWPGKKAARSLPRGCKSGNKCRSLTVAARVGAATVRERFQLVGCSVLRRPGATPSGWTAGCSVGW